MKKKSIFLVALLALVFASCGAGIKGVKPGAVYSGKVGGKTVELHIQKDNKFEAVYADKSKDAGTYKIDGNKVVILTGTYKGYVLVASGNTLYVEKDKKIVFKKIK